MKLFFGRMVPDIPLFIRMLLAPFGCLHTKHHLVEQIRFYREEEPLVFGVPLDDGNDVLSYRFRMYGIVQAGQLAHQVPLLPKQFCVFLRVLKKFIDKGHVEFRAEPVGEVDGDRRLSEGAFVAAGFKLNSYRFRPLVPLLD